MNTGEETKRNLREKKREKKENRETVKECQKTCNLKCFFQTSTIDLLDAPIAGQTHWWLVRGVVVGRRAVLLSLCDLRRFFGWCRSSVWDSH
jgi:hypothetical protein